MMNKAIISIIAAAAIFSSNIASAQQDPEAALILEKLSENTRSDSGIKIEFSVELEDQQRGFTDRFEGNMLIRGEKYKLELLDTETYFDGKSVYTFLRDANEVMISDPEEGEDEIFSNPVRLLTLYERDFRFRLRGEVTENGRTLYEIDLHPEERDMEFHTIKLFIDKETVQIESAVISGKDGSIYTLSVDNFVSGLDLSENDFSFDPEKYPGIEVIDLRW